MNRKCQALPTVAGVLENKIAEWLKGFDGYISNTWTNRNRLTITAKVPANRFEEAMNSTGNFGILNSRSISTDDVTENFYDLETRLNTRKILQQKLSGYLKDAKNISDLLEIERQLNNVTSEIESMEKQFRRLSNQIEFSTIPDHCPNYRKSVIRSCKRLRSMVY